MPAVDWDVFGKLPGSSSHNFETLCRALIHTHYSRFGVFTALANQPGVEFHLKLDTDCALGRAGKWFGWQCRWYGLTNGAALGSARRKKIEKALSTTKRAVPGLTDWVLWTRHTLTRNDQKWFHGLQTTARMKLHLHTATDVEQLLTGQAEIFRATYFGELVLTRDDLATLHATSVAAVKQRWLPEAHQVLEAEETVRRMLGEAGSWNELIAVADRLASAAKSIVTDSRGLEDPLAGKATDFANLIQTFAEHLRETHDLLAKGDLCLLWHRLDAQPKPPTQEQAAVPRHLRAARSRAGLLATNALADIRLGRLLLDDFKRLLGTRVVGVLADAGGGKTQFAAQVTAPAAGRPAGILLYGRALQARGSLNDLAQKVVPPGRASPVTSFEALVAALDAAGQRARHRLPIIIDGLNEAEDPRAWKGPLASLKETLHRYPYVLVVCTLRTGARRPEDSDPGPENLKAPASKTAFKSQALPDDVEVIDLPGFGHHTQDAVRRYFKYYRITAGDADVPLGLLSHPLTLRLFCEVTNMTRATDVGIESTPGSLSELFARYLDDAAERIAALAPTTCRYDAQDVHGALDLVGRLLWEQRSRVLDEDTLRQCLGDSARRWPESMVHALEQGGIIIRLDRTSPAGTGVMAVYDALAGHLIADSILKTHRAQGFPIWLRERATLAAFSGTAAQVHPLAADIFSALVALVPRRLLGERQLWKLLNEPLRTSALLEAARLERAYVDTVTVNALAALAAQNSERAGGLFRALRQKRSVTAHPLNTQFLDLILRPMGVADRDLRWTEWIRRYRDHALADVVRLEERWRRSSAALSPADALRAQWLMWMLTTTIIELRDRVTRALYWFGRRAPQALFDMTCGSLAINDPYVSERMLAATYGVAMAKHVDFADRPFAKSTLPSWAQRIYDLVFRENAPHGTTHILARDYASKLLELALLYRPRLFSHPEMSRIRPPFKDGGLREWQQGTSTESLRGVDSPFRMDFENYVLGRLVPARRNYDFEHAAFKRIRAEVLWRIEQLGWSPKLFGDIDQKIASAQSRSSDDRRRTERYGKKYSWIAYFERAGLQQDLGLIDRTCDQRDRPRDVDIDPSFPAPPPSFKAIPEDFLGDSRLKTEEWIANGPVPNLNPCLRLPTCRGERGPWVTLDCYLNQEDPIRGRRIFLFIRSFLVPRLHACSFFRHLVRQDLAGRWLPEVPRVIYTFAGEIPWCTSYPPNARAPFRFEVEKNRVKVRRKVSAHFLDGQPIDLTQIDRAAIRALVEGSGVEPKPLSAEQRKRVVVKQVLVEREEVRVKERRFRVLIPVQEFGWEGRSLENEFVFGTTLAKEIARDLNLMGQPQTFDSFTQQGIKATWCVGAHSDAKDTQTLFLMREDLLKQYLRKKDLALVWAAWGERQYAMAVREKWSKEDSRPDIAFRVFQTVKQFRC